ncbi:MAG: PQQ-binding-like beta-propeller repeat protein [Phycisphaerae bacterium]|nr:PQQ-binding-like beta-propeller repeat protein [Phycisphaerae bacterium]
MSDSTLGGRATVGAIVVLVTAIAAGAADWPQWGGTGSKNMAADEKHLPESFVPGAKDTASGTIETGTAKNVKWARKVCQSTYSSPVVAGGKVFLCGRHGRGGSISCLDEKTGMILWQWTGGPAAHSFGICGSPVVEGDRLYVVNQGCIVMCMDVNGQPAGPGKRKPRVLWTFDMKKAFNTEPADVHCGSCVIDGDLLYAATSNGIDPLGPRGKKMFIYNKAYKGGRIIVDDPRVYAPTAPNAPNVVVFDKTSGRLVARDDTPITKNLLKGQWSSLGVGDVAGRRLVFYGGGDGVCYAFEALKTVPVREVKLKTVWSFDCNPAEYKGDGKMPMIVRYYHGDSRWGGTHNKNDGKYKGIGEIIATPVFHKNRIYVATGRDASMGRGRGALQCIDAAKTGDATKTARLWTYQGLDWTSSTVSIADGLVYVADVAGRLHCVDAETGRPYWVHETKAKSLMGSTLVADGKVYVPTPRGLYILAAGKEKRPITHVNLGASVHSTPIAANGTLYVTSSKGWIWAVGKAK